MEPIMNPGSYLDFIIIVAVIVSVPVIIGSIREIRRTDADLRATRNDK